VREQEQEQVQEQQPQTQGKWRAGAAVQAHRLQEVQRRRWQGRGPQRVEVQGLQVQVAQALGAARQQTLQALQHRVQAQMWR
jgi:hypothetical protein